MAEGNGEWQIPGWLILIVSLFAGCVALYVLLGGGVLAVTPHVLVGVVVWATIWGVASKLKKRQP